MNKSTCQKIISDVNHIIKQLSIDIQIKNKKLINFLENLSFLSRILIIDSFSMIFFLKFITKESYLYSNLVQDLYDNIQIFDKINKIVDSPKDFLKKIKGENVPIFWETVNYDNTYSKTKNISKIKKIFEDKSIEYLLLIEQNKNSFNLGEFINTVLNNFVWPKLPNELKVEKISEIKDCDISFKLKVNMEELHLLLSIHNQLKFLL